MREQSELDALLERDEWKACAARWRKKAKALERQAEKQEQTFDEERSATEEDHARTITNLQDKLAKEKEKAREADRRCQRAELNVSTADAEARYKAAQSQLVREKEKDLGATLTRIHGENAELVKEMSQHKAKTSRMLQRLLGVGQRLGLFDATDPRKDKYIDDPDRLCADVDAAIVRLQSGPDART